MIAFEVLEVCIYSHSCNRHHIVQCHEILLLCHMAISLSEIKSIFVCVTFIPYNNININKKCKRFLCDYGRAHVYPLNCFFLVICFFLPTFCCNLRHKQSLFVEDLSVYLLLYYLGQAWTYVCDLVSFLSLSGFCR